MKLRGEGVDTHSEQWWRDEVARLEREIEEKKEQLKEWEEKKANDNHAANWRGLRAAKEALLILDRKLVAAKESLDKKTEKKRGRHEEEKRRERRRLVDEKMEPNERKEDGDDVVAEAGKDSDFEEEEGGEELAPKETTRRNAMRDVRTRRVAVAPALSPVVKKEGKKDDEFEIEKLLEYADGHIYVKWKGFNEDANSWVPLRNFADLGRATKFRDDVLEGKQREYVVEEIRDYKRTEDLFLVKWMDYPDDWNTWEPIRVFSDPGMAKRFLEKGAPEAKASERKKAMVPDAKLCLKKDREVQSDLVVSLSDHKAVVRTNPEGGELTTRARQEDDLENMLPFWGRLFVFLHFTLGKQWLFSRAYLGSEIPKWAENDPKLLQVAKVGHIQTENDRSACFLWCHMALLIGAVDLLHLGAVTDRYEATENPASMFQPEKCWLLMSKVEKDGDLRDVLVAVVAFCMQLRPQAFVDFRKYRKLGDKKSALLGCGSVELFGRFMKEQLENGHPIFKAGIQNQGVKNTMKVLRYVRDNADTMIQATYRKPLGDTLKTMLTIDHVGPLAANWIGTRLTQCGWCQDDGSALFGKGGVQGLHWLFEGKKDHLSVSQSQQRSLIRAQDFLFIHREASRVFGLEYPEMARELDVRDIENVSCGCQGYLKNNASNITVLENQGREAARKHFEQKKGRKKQRHSLH